jgi:hypothetical protein
MIAEYCANYPGAILVSQYTVPKRLARMQQARSKFHKVPFDWILSKCDGIAGVISAYPPFWVMFSSECRKLVAI